jgi:pyrroline-5-carboxylate reductase
MENIDGPILLVGCGRMGDALLRGWLDRGVTASDVTVIETSEKIANAARDRGVATRAALDELPNNFAPRVVVFAVKPQAMLDVVPRYRRLVGPNTMFLSIAAGKALAFFETHLGADATVIRAMPNTPAAIGRGMTVVCANAGASSTDRELAEKLMTAAGAVAWIEDEALMDGVTAVSGSGPAYIFHMIECLAAAGVAAGLPADLSAQLARATVEGAAALSHQDGSAPETLRQNVTSPGGTTAAALAILMDDVDGLQAVMTRAVAAAANRSRELAD